jgi:hypothetical protein
MASVTLWFLDGQLGKNIFSNTTAAYRAEHGVYPTVTKELPKWLTKNGWPCKGATDYFPRPIGGKMKQVETTGLQFANEEALTAFILKWGGQWHS